MVIMVVVLDFYYKGTKKQRYKGKELFFVSLYLCFFVLIF